MKKTKLTKSTKSNKKRNAQTKKKKIERIAKSSFLEKKISKKSNLRKKDLKKLKEDSLKMSVFISLFCLLGLEVMLKNLFLAIGLSVIIMAIVFVLMMQMPMLRIRKRVRRAESDLAYFLLDLITELKVGKDFLSALKKVCGDKNFAAQEYAHVLRDIEKGSSLKEALERMNNELQSNIIRRVNSNLMNLYLHGNKTGGAKKFADELLLKQRIQSKEFSGKMVVFALVFIAVSAIVPAMFSSFILIGSYFMKIQFTAIQVFIIIVLVFPMMDASVLMLINSKTPLFLKSR
jgi:pilus assembly protein TadC